MRLGTMSNTPKSSASSRPAALKSTNAGVTKAERIVRYRTDPAVDRKLARDRRKRLEALETVPDSQIDFSDIPPLDEKFWSRAIQPARYPPVPVDARVVEWFMKRSGNRTSLMFDINRVLQDYIRTEEKKAARKKAG